MTDHKKNQVSADEQKASSILPDATLTPVVESKKKIRKAPKIKKARKKSLPIAVDILVVFLLIAVIAGALGGIYALGNYFATRYAQRGITYTLLVENADAALALDADGNCVVLPDSNVFVVEAEKSTAVGKVTSVSVENHDDGTVDLYVVVRAKADYNYTLGYFADQVKIAVGKAYTCRFSGLVSDAVIVELQITEKES